MKYKMAHILGWVQDWVGLKCAAFEDDMDPLDKFVRCSSVYVLFR